MRVNGQPAKEPLEEQIVILHPGAGEETEEKMCNDAIRRRAYELYVKRGAQPGHELEDWFEAEREIRGISPQRSRMMPIDP